MISDAKRTSDELGKFKDMSNDEKQDIARIVGLGALKYFILKVDARKNMLFNPAESIDFNGNTGPFIQYTYARIRSIMRNAAAQNIQIPAELPADAPLNDKEMKLIQKMDDFKIAVHDAGENYNPAGIANYCYELTKDFNQFYHDYSTLKPRNLRALSLPPTWLRPSKTAWNCSALRCPSACNSLLKNEDCACKSARLPPRHRASPAS